ncbi:MAG: hypothetical protein ACE37F_30525 [Nannocystaceae bacterium]|nr:hypothetical protein [bacterium]
MMNSKALALFAMLTLATSVSCDDKKDDAPAKEEVKVLEKAPNGSPVSAEFIEFTGDGEDRGMKVRLYNHGDKKAVGYMLLFKFYDGDDKVLKVKPGTPFEDDHTFTSMSGLSFACEPKKNTVLEVRGTGMGVPADAKRAEVLVSKVDTVGEGAAIEDWFEQDGGFSKWPEAAK